MKLLQVGKYYPPVNGGIENNVHALCAGLASRYDVTALVFNSGPRTILERCEGVNVVRVASYGRVLSTEMAPSFLLWFLRFRHADIIHLHTPNPLGEFACLFAPHGAKLVITYHSDVIRQRFLGRFNRILLHRLMRRADRIIAYTRRYMETSPVIKHYAGKTSIIPHGVDLHEFEITETIKLQAQELRARYGPRIVIFIGRLVYYKGLDILLRALARVPDATLLIVGEGPKENSLRSLARELRVIDRSIFLGRLSHQEKVACLHACDLLALPAMNRAEAFGQVQVEALACGRPVISTKIDSGVPFVSLDNVCGLTVEPGDAAQLAGAITTLLDDDDLRARLGQAGRRRVEELFSREVMLRDTIALYDAMLGNIEPAGAPQVVLSSNGGRRS